MNIPNKNVQLNEKFREFQTENNQTYGYRRSVIWLKQNKGVNIKIIKTF